MIHWALYHKDDIAILYVKRKEISLYGFNNAKQDETQYGCKYSNNNRKTTIIIN